MQYAIDTGIISIGDIRKRKEMKNREDILNGHPYSIWNGANGGYYTYLPDKEKGRVLKKRKSREDIENLIIGFYRKNEDGKKKAQIVKPRPRKTINKKSFKNVFNMLKEYKKYIACVSDNTIYKYDKGYDRFFKGTKIELKDITSIDDEFWIDFIVAQIKSLEITQSAGKKMIDYINATLKHGMFKKMITTNPCSNIDRTIFKRHYKNNSVHSAKNRTVSDEQMERLNIRFQ